MVRFGTIARAHWGRVVDAVASLGFDAIDIPLVWREHEVGPGTFDFEQGTRALDEMLTLARGAGLGTIVRVGPVCSDEAPAMGLPERIVRDVACQARTPRGNTVWVPDPPRIMPWPSIASEAYGREASAWVTAACQAIARSDPDGTLVSRVIVGHGPHPTFRNDPEHHPDEGPDPALTFAMRLADAANAAGIARDRVTISITGGLQIAPCARTLATTNALALASPHPSSGTMAVWRAVQHGGASTRLHGLHWDVWCGGPVFHPPMRGAHAVEAARVAVLAGAESVTVRMACAGSRWIGAILGETGGRRAHSALWADWNAWAGDMAIGEDIAADLVEPQELVRAARDDASIDPLPTPFAAFLGWTAGQIASDDVAVAGSKSLAAAESSLAGAERSLRAAGLPVRRVSAGAEGPLAWRCGDSTAGFTRRATAALESVALDVDPRDAAIVRAMICGERAELIVLNHTASPVRVRPHAEGWRRGDDIVEPGTTVELAGGESLRLHRPAAEVRVPSADAVIASRTKRRPAVRRRSAARPPKDGAQ